MKYNFTLPPKTIITGVGSGIYSSKKTVNYSCIIQKYIHVTSFLVVQTNKNHTNKQITQAKLQCNEQIKQNKQYSMVLTGTGLSSTINAAEVPSLFSVILSEIQQ